MDGWLNVNFTPTPFVNFTPTPFVSTPFVLAGKVKSRGCYWYQCQTAFHSGIQISGAGVCYSSTGPGAPLAIESCYSTALDTLGTILVEHLRSMEYFAASIKAQFPLQLTIV